MSRRGGTAGADAEAAEPITGQNPPDAYTDLAEMIARNVEVEQRMAEQPKHRYLCHTTANLLHSLATHTLLHAAEATAVKNDTYVLAVCIYIRWFRATFAFSDTRSSGYGVSDFTRTPLACFMLAFKLEDDELRLGRGLSSTLVAVVNGNNAADESCSLFQHPLTEKQLCNEELQVAKAVQWNFKPFTAFDAVQKILELNPKVADYIREDVYFNIASAYCVGALQRMAPEHIAVSAIVMCSCNQPPQCKWNNLDFIPPFVFDPECICRFRQVFEAYMSKYSSDKNSNGVTQEAS